MKNTRDNIVKYLEAAYKNLKFLVDFEREGTDGDKAWADRMEAEAMGYRLAIDCLTNPKMFAELAAILLDEEN